MRFVAKAPSAGSTQRQATGLGRFFVALLAATLATLALAATPAHAAKGWAFLETFGSGAKPEFAEDRDLAVDHSSGDLLVADVGANESQQITFTGFANGNTFSLGNLPASCTATSTAPIEYISTAGTRATRVRTALEAKCGANFAASGSNVGSATVTVTFQGALGFAPQALMSCTKETGTGSCSVAETAAGNHRGVKRFNPDGTPSDFAALGSNLIDGKGGADAIPSGEIVTDSFVQIAVDNSGTATDGNIYVADAVGATWVDIFSSAGQFLGRLTEAGASGSFGGVTGVGVDEAGNVYVREFGEIHRFEPSANPPVNGDHAAGFPASGFGNIVVGAGPSDGSLFFTTSAFNGISKLDSTTGALEYKFAENIGASGSSSLTLDPATGHVFVRSASKEVAEYDASGNSAEAVIQVAKLEDAGTNVSGIAVAQGAEELYLSRASTNLVDVWEEVPVPEATIGPPSVVSGAKATATATVNPAAVAVTECFFQYGKTTAYGQTAPCKEALPTDENDHQVTAQLTGMLAQGTTYHYRLVAKAAGGQGVSADETLKTADTFHTKAASDVSETEATLNGTVRAEGVALTNCLFEWGKTIEYGQIAPCNPHFSAIPNDDADHAVGALLTGLEAATTYHYRLIAQNSLGQIVAKDRTFSTQGAPGIEAQVASALSETTATLQAQINPFGSPTTYHFEWGTDDTYPNRIPADHELFAGSGSEPVLVNAELSGLQSASEYYFRIVATSSKGRTEGPDHAFETLNEHGLPDNRAFELVTPVDKGPAGSLENGFSQQVSPQASQDGGSFVWPLLNGMPGTSAGGWLRMKASRGEAGWLSTQLSSPSLIEPPEVDGVGFALPSIVSYTSSDLRCGLLETYNPITADTPPQSVEHGVENLYLWREDGNGVSYELISDRVPLNPGAIPVGPDYYTQVEAADDCSRVYFRSIYELIGGSSGLYEWDEGTLRDAGVLPNGGIGSSMPLPLALGSSGRAVVGSEVELFLTSRWNAVSPDGSRLFFTAIANEGPSAGKPAVFMRENGSVVEISASQTAVPTNGARFEAVSPDGDVVFFRANYGIADTTSPGATNQACGPLNGETIFVALANVPVEAKRCDLYAYDVESEELTDLSADPNPADPTGAAAQGTVAISEDGSHAYFAALGQLVPGEGRTYAQNIAGQGSANVYLAQGGELSYVTTLERGTLQNREDLFGALIRFTGNWSAETSADGGRLVFESTSKLTWYDGEGGKAAYLYDAESGEVACVSCPPDGAPTLLGPDGLLGNQPDAPKLLSGGGSMSEDGSRVFFTSPDVLVSGAQAGKRNVYEWEEGQAYFLARAERALGPASSSALLVELANYLDASDDGTSAFVATNGRLAPQDRDSLSDVYALRVGGGFPFTPPPVPCNPAADECQGDPTPQPAAPSPAGAGFSGPGNPPPPEGRPQSKTCPKGKVKRRGKCVKRAKRAAKRKRGQAANTRAANTNRGGAA